MHPCQKCKYYYETECSKSDTVFDVLMDGVRTISVKYKAPCCGYEAGGQMLDKEAPVCHNFEETK
jgi:hypothetical protein